MSINITTLFFFFLSLLSASKIYKSTTAIISTMVATSVADTFPSNTYVCHFFASSLVKFTKLSFVLRSATSFRHPVRIEFTLAIMDYSASSSVTIPQSALSAFSDVKFSSLFSSLFPSSFSQ